jgi:SEC-C motif-containing protein
MRSRFSAYALNLTEYIYATTHPKHQATIDKQQLAYTNQHTQWTNLVIKEITPLTNYNTQGFVTFEAYYLDNGKEVSFEEHSCFEKIDFRWYYDPSQSTVKT